MDWMMDPNILEQCMGMEGCLDRAPVLKVDSNCRVARDIILAFTAEVGIAAAEFVGIELDSEYKGKAGH
jgi:hypothetical protein